MRAIDVHVHLYPPEASRDPCAWAEVNGEPQWSTLCTRCRKDGRPVQFFVSVDELLREMDAAGVERSVLLGWYWETQAACVAQNRFYVDCVRAHPDRLSAFATVQVSAGAAALEEVWWAKEHGLIGLGELSPHAQGIAMDDARWTELLALAADLEMPVNLHVTDPLSRSFPGRVETPLVDFVNLARAFPRTRFVLAHWGGGLAFDVASRELTNVWFDTAASPLMYGEEVWARALAAAGPARILFGSDFPLRLYPRAEEGSGWATFVGEARRALAPSVPQALNDVLRENAAALLWGGVR